MSTESDPGSAGIVFGRGARVDKIEVGGDVVGRDKIVSVTPQQAADVQDRTQLLELVRQLQAQVQELSDAPKGLQQDAADELAKAQQAGEDRDDGRLVEKLESARGFLERIGETLPAALAVAQTVATLVQRVPGLS